MQPVQYDLRRSAANDNTIMQAVVAPYNHDAATSMQFADTALQNTIQLRITARQITAPKPDFDAKAEKSTILKAFY